MRLLLIGPPGGGKGTQAKYLIDHFDIPQISTGDMLRANIHNNTNLGKDAQKFMNSGQLVPDSIILDMIKERLTDQDCDNGFVLDGFLMEITESTVEVNPVSPHCVGVCPSIITSGSKCN